MLDNRTIQQHLNSSGFRNEPVTGIISLADKISAEALLNKNKIKTDSWTQDRVLVAYQQFILQSLGFKVGTIDGMVGPQTQWALEQYQNRIRDEHPPVENIKHQPTVFPRQEEVPNFYGKVGENQEQFLLPYPMKLAWDKDTIIKKITLHKKVGQSAQRALEAIKNHYGIGEIDFLGLNIFGGGLNVREMRGGTKYSMHSWGIAIDFDPENNQLRWGRDKAKLARPECEQFWKCWEAEGWVSLGKERNYDWMHVQAARL